MYDWEALWATFEPIRFNEAFRGRLEIAGGARHAFSHPKREDCEWLAASLRHERRKWLVAEIARNASVHERLFSSMLDAGIDETNPSANRCFIEPCMKAFGPRRVNEYLLDAIAAGDDYRKAGAVNALYWAAVPMKFSGSAPSTAIEHASPESRKQYESLADVWHRKRLLLLETFVHSTSVDVQRSIIPSLSLDPNAYPESHRAMLARAIEMGRNHGDAYVKHRTGVQLGNRERLLEPLPHRKPRTTG